MKKFFISGAFFLFALSAKAQTTIYNGNSSLTSSRTVSLGSYSLQFKPLSGTGLYITPTGPVGLGTQFPSEMFDVAGNTKAYTGVFTRSAPNGQSFSSNLARVTASRVLSAGTLVDSGLNGRILELFDFPQSNMNATPTTWFALSDRNNMARLRFVASANSSSSFTLYDMYQAENFKMGEDGNGNVYVQIPKTNSRLVVAGWGDYLPQYKFVVRGSSKIEGNILTDSNIGIGTESFTDGSDSYRLSVNGNVRAHRVKVYTTWADYVFEEDYKLPTLDEVEEHIKQKGHLKDIPSAKEVEENGIELGEMNKLLLQKIEELTLYTIELNKEIKELKAQVNNK